MPSMLTRPISHNMLGMVTAAEMVLCEQACHVIMTGTIEVCAMSATFARTSHSLSFSSSSGFPILLAALATSRGWTVTSIDVCLAFARYRRVVICTSEQRNSGSSQPAVWPRRQAWDASGRPRPCTGTELAGAGRVSALGEPGDMRRGDGKVEGHRGDTRCQYSAASTTNRSHTSLDRRTQHRTRGRRWR